jgi:hypothetical protein
MRTAKQGSATIPIAASADTVYALGHVRDFNRSRTPNIILAATHLSVPPA